MPSYNSYPAYATNSYQQPYPQTLQPQYPVQSGNSYAMNQPAPGIVWVDGEVGAKAFQLPSGWPVNAPMPLWDTNDTIIYLKSFNQMGMPNPIQKLHYTMDEQQKNVYATSSQAALPAATKDDAQPARPEEDYARRSDLEQMKEELKAAIASMQTEQKGARSNGKSSV